MTDLTKQRIIELEGTYGRYQIYEDGRVWKAARPHSTGRFLKHWLNRYGYPSVRLYTSNMKPKVVTIHRLVAQAFIPNPKNLPEVNHKDGSKGNFSINNLEWVSGRQNLQHAYDTGLRIPKSQTGEKYVSWDKVNQKYRVIINNRDGSKSRVGRYSTLKEAVKARDLILKSYD